MKTTAILLALLLSAASARSQTNAAPVDVHADLTLCEAILLVGAGGMAGTLIIYAMKSTSDVNKCVCPATLVLEANPYTGIWTPVATNTITAHCETNRFEVFRMQRSDEGSLYRVRVYKIQ